MIPTVAEAQAEAKGGAPRRGAWLLPLGVVVLLTVPVALHFVLKGLHRDPPEDLGTLPAFALTDQRAQPFSAADLDGLDGLDGRDGRDGKLWVVDFFFSRCNGVCPLLTARMKDVLRFADSHPRFASRIGLLSITVDPQGDTPERLAAFGKANFIDPARWHLLTGPSKAVEDVVVRGFHMAMGEPEGDVDKAADPTADKARFDILHGTHLVLVGKRRRILGYYDGDPAGVERLERDLGRILDARDRGEAP